ncbi:putative inorganic phosphate cotransporter [Drosophila innubila]|uniref:putative inorganic phosphate cotransporter n=1 Tax=Drosophila innubila TaxID=198719 RepID=UPI00148B628A|nr:putative inorganic phosphate cotransporter [Drosophila innubila]
MVKNRRFEEESSGFGVRHVQILLLFCALAVGFGMRVNLSVAIVAMAEFPEYNWSEKIKSLVLSSFFWGYVLTQLPAGPLARRFGGKVTILTGLSVCSVLTVLTPLCAKLGGWKLLCAVRLLEGVCQGFLFPSCHTVISAWAPPKERASMGNFTYAGNQFGTIIMLATSGLLAAFGGWPCIYYASGGIGCVWAVVYYLYGASSPAESKSISAEERALIEMGQAGERTVAREEGEEAHQQITPWLSIIRSPAVLALVIVQSSYAYGFYTLLTQIPSYMKNVLGKDIKSNALLSSLPYTAMLLLSLAFAWISKILQKKDSLSLSFNRKLFNSIGFIGPMILLIALGYVSKDQDTLAVVLLILTVGISSAAHVGFLINHIDLSPNFAGIIMGICNCIANFMSLAAPLVVGVIVTNNKDAFQWRLVFFVAAAIYFIGSSVFLIFGRTHVQDWNDPPARISRNPTPQLESQKQ